jgi:muramoyltetrapeptide carboxypeptidase
MISISKFRVLLIVFLIVFPAMVIGSTRFTNQIYKNMNQELIQPPYLQKGDTVLILATAGIVSDSTIIDNGIELLKNWGLNVKLGKNLYESNGHFAGTDKHRLEDFQKAIDDNNIKAIWCARGGYGTVRIIDDIDFTKFKQHPKWVIGFSDVTVLHNEIHNLGIETMHAMMPSTLKPGNEEQKKAQKSLYKALFGKKIKYRVSESDYNKEGEATGQLVGGNLSILYSLLGSKSTISVENKILFIEDVGEYEYHIDRMLLNLKRNGYFKNCQGLIIGGISEIRENDVTFGKTVEEIVLDAVKEYDFPISFDFPAGHIRDNRTLILGREISLLVKDNKAVVKFLK